MTFEEFYQSYHRKVLRFLLHKGLSQGDAEDLTSQVFLYCFEHWGQYDPAKASQASWVYLVARSRLKNFWRDRKQFVNLEELSDVLPDTGSEVEQAQLLDEQREALAAALGQLAENQRSMVILRYFQGLSAQEIAWKLHMSPGAVRTQLSRTLGRLEGMLAAVCG